MNEVRENLINLPTDKLAITYNCIYVLVALLLVASLIGLPFGYSLAGALVLVTAASLLLASQSYKKD